MTVISVVLAIAIVLALLAVGILIAHPVMSAPAVSQFATRADGPVFAGTLFPFLFITVACGAGDVLRLTRLQRAGGKRLPAADFLRGFALAPGMVLGA